MEEKEDLKSVLPYLPLLVRSSTLFWPSKVVEALKSMAKGPEHSQVNSGEVLSVAICDIRSSLSLFEPLAPFASMFISRAESTKWFGEVVPALANFLLKLPSLLESHYLNADDFLGKYGIKTDLRILGPQEAGIAFLRQELIGALLACSFFCLFPVTNRGANHLPTINFDKLFTVMDRVSCTNGKDLKVIAIWVLPLDSRPLFISYPDADAWSKSAVPLCPFEAYSLGSIEDHSTDALQVDFANKYIGGGALHRGCVQEEIRFMINPELIAGMLFLPLADNEAIEIVGAERFSDYNGYASSFRFSGDHVDKRNVDVFRRRKTRIIAIDALCWPGMKQYALIPPSLHEASSTGVETNEGISVNLMLRNSDQKSCQFLRHKDSLGIVTGNWGCGAFGGDPELKAMIQWLAASQALRPFMSYYTFGVEALQNLGQVTQWILSHEWTVGDLWNMMVEYSSQRLNGQTNLGFLPYTR
ncbi:hypothetical protein Pint_26034 [Pistacia integerrima]|uniref:Uncharacterized protein n=1 Tax=Pistacia integerrima TaxID=434235 RepID=A0ACC0YC58_9ROSI|nr:hypothetical protein Pint_26034 [Pistacia integerrima]